MVIPPQLIAAGVQLGTSLFGGGDNAAPTAPVELFTPEMRDALIGSAQSFQKSLEGIYGTGSFAPGGISTSQTSRVAPQEMKKQAFIQFRMSKGDSLEEATQKANAAMGGYGKKKGFVNAVGSGQFNDLSIGKDGKIKAAEKYTPGGVRASSESEMLRQFYNDLNAQALGAASGLPLAYRSDENRALGVRNPLTGAALNQVMNLNQVGLTPREQQNIDAIEKYYTDKLGTVIDKSTNDFIGSVENSGFQSSSLAKDMYMDIAGKPQAEYASDIAAKLAAQYSDMLNAAVNRQQAGLTGSLNAFNTIGKLSGADAITAAGGSPGEYGLFTDLQSAALAAEIQQANIGNRIKGQSFVQDALGRPISVVPEPQTSWAGRVAQGLGLASSLSGDGKETGARITGTAPGVNPIFTTGSNLFNKLGSYLKNAIGGSPYKSQNLAPFI